MRMRQFNNDQGSQKSGKMFMRRKSCRFCAEKELRIDYKDGNTLRHFVTERGKIIPRRISGNCARHQRAVTNALKRARILGMMPFTVVQSI